MGWPPQPLGVGVSQTFGNACVSRRQIISSHKKEDKAKVVAKYKVGDLIKDAIVKSWSSFGVFFDVKGELDVLCHTSEISYSRVNSPDEIFNVGDAHDLKVISVDTDKLQVGVSVKQLGPDPFERISNYELNKPYQVKIMKLMEYGAFCELEPGLTTLLHQSELHWTKKNPSAKKMFKKGDIIPCVITEISKEKKRISISHRLTKENPYDALEKKYPVGTVCNAVITSINEYAIFCQLDGFEIETFLHCGDLSYTSEDPEEELKKYKVRDSIRVKVLEIRKDQQKVRVGLRQTKSNPYDWFKDKKINQALTLRIISSNNRGLTVRPEGGCELNFVIKKANIAINAADARPSRFMIGDRVDAAIQDLDLSKKKINLSIKLLEQLQNKEAVSKFSSPLSGKNLPFKSLSEKLEKKEKK